MPQTETKVVRCPSCNAAYNAASVPPGKGFRCKKCSTVVPGPSAEPAQQRPVEKKATSRIDRKAGSGSTSRMTRPGSHGTDRTERPGSQRGGKPPAPKKSPMPFIVGGVILVVIVGLAIAKMNQGPDEPQKTTKPKETPKAETVKAEKPREKDAFEKALDSDPAKPTPWAKERQKGFNSQDRSKVDPAGSADPNKPPDAQPPAKDPPDDGSKKDNQ